MWIRDGAGYFFGPIFIHPEETEHEPTKMFYKKETFLSNLEETCPMTCIIGTLCIVPQVVLTNPFLINAAVHLFDVVMDYSLIQRCFTGKCIVLSFKDYLSCRPTEVPEKDVLLCESRYIESEKQMKKFKGLKRFSLSGKVVEDETYYFR